MEYELTNGRDYIIDIEDRESIEILEKEISQLEMEKEKNTKELDVDLEKTDKTTFEGRNMWNYLWEKHDIKVSELNKQINDKQYQIQKIKINIMKMNNSMNKMSKAKEANRINIYELNDLQKTQYEKNQAKENMLIIAGKRECTRLQREAGYITQDVYERKMNEIEKQRIEAQKILEWNERVLSDTLKAKSIEYWETQLKCGNVTEKEFEDKKNIPFENVGQFEKQVMQNILELEIDRNIDNIKKENNKSQNNKTNTKNEETKIQHRKIKINTQKTYPKNEHLDNEEIVKQEYKEMDRVEWFKSLFNKIRKQRMEDLENAKWQLREDRQERLERENPEFKDKGRSGRLM